MYANKLIACIKADGKILREKGDEVYLPFGTEYSLYFKNSNTKKVKINIDIDGQDVLFGKSIIINPDDTFDLKGYIKDTFNRSDNNRAFKFIKKTKSISDFRGDRIDDGLIKISYQFEQDNNCKYDKDADLIKAFHQKFYYHGSEKHISYTNNLQNENNINIQHKVHPDNIDTLGGFVNNLDNTLYTQFKSAYNPLDNTSFNNCINEPGITVEGSKTSQSFEKGYIGFLENKVNVMIFQLKSLTAEEQVQEPITIQLKKVCTSCGKKWKNNFEYCPYDGTYLRYI